MRFVFVCLGSFSGANRLILERLQQEFPELEAQRFDIKQWVRGRRSRTALNLLHTLAEYGARPFIDRSLLWGSFYRTDWLYRAVRRELAALASDGDVAFTFQTQSLFDGSVPGVPHFIYTDHTQLVNRRYPDFDGSREPPEEWLAREREIFEHASKVFTMGTHVASSLVTDYGIAEERVTRVLAGCCVDQGELLAIEPDYAGKRILFVGREWERKGGPDLLAAFALVRERHPDARLVIVGAQPEVRAEGVELLGEVDLAQLLEQYRRAAVFCMPSLIEPYGLAYVEALTSGLPVVATAIGALPELIGDGRGGYLLEPHDAEGIAAALDRLLSDPALARRLGQAGRAFVRDGHSWEACVGRMADVIRGELRGPRSAELAGR